MQSLALKLTLAFLLVSLAGIGLVALLAGQVTAREVGHFVDAEDRNSLVSELAAAHAASGNWETMPPLPLGYTVVDRRGSVIRSASGHAAGKQLMLDEMGCGKQIAVNGEIVGLLIKPPYSGDKTTVSEVTTRVNRSLLLGGLGATTVSLLLGMLLTRSLTHPLRELTEATRAVAGGNLNQQVPIRSRDELGELATAFNQMNLHLAQSRNLRRQMTADVAHELRTPLSLILGHAEALSEGVLPPTQESFQIIYEEAQRLSLLVEDLRTLSLTDAGELPLTRYPVSPQTLLERVVAAHTSTAQQQQVSLQATVAADLPEILVDPDRSTQVLANLVGNALRYTPPGGAISLSARTVSGALQIRVRDSGPGIPPAELPHIFERFYRGDKSRQRHDGGSGLGLAIARSLVEAQGGQIRAESQPGAGLIVILEFPL